MRCSFFIAQNPFTSTVILSFHRFAFFFKKKKHTCELLTSIDSTSYFFLLLPLCGSITRSLTSRLPLPCSHWDVRSGAPGSWPWNKCSPCAALFAQWGVFLKQRRFTALPCGSHLRVCACACVLVWERSEVCPTAQFVHSSCTFFTA